MHYIDKEVLSRIEGTTDPDQQTKRFAEYEGIITGLRIQIVEEYLLSKGIAQDKIDMYLDGQEDTYDDVELLLQTDEFLDLMDSEIDAYNESYYVKARQTLSSDQIASLNAYLDEVDKVRAAELKNIVDGVAQMIKLEQAKDSSAVTVDPAVPVSTTTVTPTQSDNSQVQPISVSLTQGIPRPINVYP